MSVAPTHDPTELLVVLMDSGWNGMNGLVAVSLVELDSNNAFDTTVVIPNCLNLNLLLAMLGRACMVNGPRGLSVVKNVQVVSVDVINIMTVEVSQLSKSNHVVRIDGPTGRFGLDVLLLVPVNMTYSMYDSYYDSF